MNGEKNLREFYIPEGFVYHLKSAYVKRGLFCLSLERAKQPAFSLIWESCFLKKEQLEFCLETCS
jgi:hypothetical protein